jgi:hypothetical protein
MADHLIPPTEKPPSKRSILVAAAWGTAVGAVLGFAAWAFTGDAFWLLAVPVGALFGAQMPRERPNVLWGQRAR